MAQARSSNFEALAQQPYRHTEEDSDSDIEFVSKETGTQLRFNPLGAVVSQLLQKRLEVQHGGIPVTAARELGPPCKSVYTLGDGNCFFRAISYALCGTDQYHFAIRQAAVKQLESYAGTYKSILRTEYHGSVSAYLRKSRMHSPGRWATEVEIQATADFLGVSIYTYYLDRWIEYGCKGVVLSDQGIYLENCGCHYKTVICVKAPQLQACYNYCKMDMSGSGVPQESSPSVVESNHHEGDTDPAEDGDYERVRDPAKEEDCERNGDPAEEEDYERERDPTDKEEDYGRDGDPDVEGDHERDEHEDQEDVTHRQQMQPNLSWSVLNTSWGYDLEWLNTRWWGQVSKEDVINFMDMKKRRSGDIVVTAPFDDTPGAVCSITIKTEDSVLMTDVVICRGFYRCTSLLQDEFPDFVKLIRGLVADMKYVHIQPMSKKIRSNPMHFSAAHVARELHDLMTTMPHVFWGTYKRAKSSVRYRIMMEQLQISKRRSVNPTGRPKLVNTGAVIHCTKDDSYGYLFEVITDKGRKVRVTFDRRGYTVGNGCHFDKIINVLSYISTVEQVTFLSVSRSWDSVE